MPKRGIEEVNFQDIALNKPDPKRQRRVPTDAWYTGPDSIKLHYTTYWRLPSSVYATATGPSLTNCRALRYIVAETNRREFEPHYIFPFAPNLMTWGKAEKAADEPGVATSIRDAMTLDGVEHLYGPRWREVYTAHADSSNTCFGNSNDEQPILFMSEKVYKQLGYSKPLRSLEELAALAYGDINIKSVQNADKFADEHGTSVLIVKDGAGCNHPDSFIHDEYSHRVFTATYEPRMPGMFKAKIGYTGGYVLFGASPETIKRYEAAHPSMYIVPNDGWVDSNGVPVSSMEYSAATQCKGIKRIQDAGNHLYPVTYELPMAAMFKATVRPTNPTYRFNVIFGTSPETIKQHKAAFPFERILPNDRWTFKLGVKQKVLLLRQLRAGTI